MERALLDRDEFLAEVRDRLEQAQQHYKAVYDRRHRPLEFAPGQWVWLPLLHRPVASLQVKGRGKLGPKFFGPFRVLDRIGDVANRLELPAGARIHVGLLKPFHGEPPSKPTALSELHHGRVVVQPEKVLKGRLARGRQELLVQWMNTSAAETSWVDLEEFRQQLPHFQLEDELLFQGGRDVMWGRSFVRRKHRREESHIVKE